MAWVYYTSCFDVTLDDERFGNSFNDRLAFLHRLLHQARMDKFNDNAVSRESDKSKDAPSDARHQVQDVPMHVIMRPIPPVLEESKVQSLMSTLQNSTECESVPPIDIMWITGEEGGNYFYSFGGCHRYEAHKRLNKPTIKGNLIKATAKDLVYYLGASTPQFK